MTRTCIRLSIVKLPLLKYDKQQDCEHSNTNESNSIQHLLTFCQIFSAMTKCITGEEHKVFMSDKASDNGYYLLTFMSAEKELRGKDWGSKRYLCMECLDCASE